MPSIAEVLRSAELPDSPSASVDAQWLLAAVLGKPSSYLRAWPERELTAEQVVQFEGYLARRRLGEPVAYIIGQQGFWSLELAVAPHTLIPRPDTELLVETALSKPFGGAAHVLDLGTGTGAIALAIASERPTWQVLGVDRIAEAVVLAEQNRQRLKLSNCRFQQSDWFAQLAPQRFDLLVSNPPYIPASDPHLQQGDVRFEPASALVSGEDGLDDIRHLIATAPHWLKAQGWLMLEHGYDQAEAVAELMRAQGFIEVQSLRDFGGQWRITLGCWSKESNHAQ